MKIAVIENEFGAVSIDTALVEANVREVGNDVNGLWGDVVVFQVLGDWRVL